MLADEQMNRSMENMENIDRASSTMWKFMYVIKVVYQITGRKIDFLKLSVVRTAKQSFENR